MGLRWEAKAKYDKYLLDQKILLLFQLNFFQKIHPSIYTGL